MIDGLDAHDLGAPSVIVLLEISEKLELRGGGPDNQNLLCSLEFAGDFVEEPFVVLGMILDALWASWMLVMKLVRGQHYLLIDLVRADGEDSGLFVVEPNGDLLGHDESFLGSLREPRASHG